MMKEHEDMFGKLYHFSFGAGRKGQEVGRDGFSVQNDEQMICIEHIFSQSKFLEIILR